MYYDNRDNARRAIQTAVRQRCRLTHTQSALGQVRPDLQPQTARATANRRENALIGLIDHDRCVGTLDPLAQLLLQDRYSAGLTNAETATLHGISARTCNRRVSDALNSLAAVMVERGLL